jgi:endonuclease YncB( thermonuclease family)
MKKNKYIQEGGSFLLTDIESLRNKIVELKQLSKDGVKECLSSVQLDTTGSKKTLEDRLIEYIFSASPDIISETKLSLEEEHEDIVDTFNEIEKETFNDLYKTINYKEYCSTFRMNYDLRYFRIGGQGTITSVESACVYYYKHQTEYQNKVKEILVKGNVAYEKAQDYFEDTSPDRINKNHIDKTIVKYQEALNDFNSFITYTNFSFTNFFTYELHKILPNFEVVNRLMSALGSIQAVSRRRRRAWAKQKILEISSIIFTLRKQSNIMKGTKKKGVFYSMFGKSTIEGFHNKMLSSEAIKYEDMFKNIEIWAKPTSVYDGDTLTVNILFPPKGGYFIDEEKIGQFVTSIKVRCNGYDTPEMKGKTVMEKRCALISRVAFIRKIDFISKDNPDNGLILIRMSGLDKYGRALGTIYKVEDNEKIDVNQFMIENNYGYPYSGATKTAEQFLKENSKHILDMKESLQFTEEEDKKYNNIK